MSTKFSIATMSIAAMLVLTNSAIANAFEAYKTSLNEVVVTGLPHKNRYEIKAIDDRDKLISRSGKSVNSCGHIVIQNAANLKMLFVGSMRIDPSSLETKPHERCQSQPRFKKMQPQGVERAITPGSN
jgi:hypothetical protein